MPNLTWTDSFAADWTVPAGVTAITAEGIGPGGMGASAHAAEYDGFGGGGGGAYAQSVALAVTPGEILTASGYTPEGGDEAGYVMLARGGFTLFRVAGGSGFEGGGGGASSAGGQVADCVYNAAAYRGGNGYTPGSGDSGRGGGGAASPLGPGGDAPGGGRGIGAAGSGYMVGGNGGSGVTGNEYLPTNFGGGGGQYGYETDPTGDSRMPGAPGVLQVTWAAPAVPPGGTFRRPGRTWPRTLARPGGWRRIARREFRYWCRIWRYDVAVPRLSYDALAKSASDNRDYLFDFSGAPELAGGDTIAGATITGGSGLTIGAAAATTAAADGIAAGKAVKVRISGGTAGQVYDLACIATLASGRAIVVPGRLAVAADY